MAAEGPPSTPSANLSTARRGWPAGAGHDDEDTPSTCPNLPAVRCSAYADELDHDGRRPDHGGGNPSGAATSLPMPPPRRQRPRLPERIDAQRIVPEQHALLRLGHL